MTAEEPTDTRSGTTDEVRNPRRETNLGAAVLIIATTVIYGLVLAGFFVALGRVDRYVPSPWWASGWVAIAGYMAWWSIFFLGSEERAEYAGIDFPLFRPFERFVERRVTTLPTFLEFQTPRVAVGVDTSPDGARQEGSQDPADAIDDLAQKAGQTIQTVSAIVGFALLIFSFTVNFLLSNEATLSAVDSDLLIVIALVQIVSIVAILIGMESLDTSINAFTRMDWAERYRTSSAYYRTGIYYYYRGLVLLIFSAFLFTMIVHPAVTVVGVAVFAVLGYRYWFGYTG